MTGYGRGQSETTGCRITVEIRSVNHRFLDLKLRGSSLDAASEEKLRQLIGKTISRGALNLSMRVDRQDGPGAVHIDQEAAIRAHRELDALRKTLGLNGEVPLAMVCKQPGVMVASEVDADAIARVGEGVCIAAEHALEELCAMRLVEGKALHRDITQRVQSLDQLAQALAKSVETSSDDGQTRLRERITRLLKNSKVEVDEARLAQEVAMFADRLDVTEELVRVRSHLEQLQELLAQEKPVGRRLDFLVQELGREFNTVTSKSQSADVALLVVEAKAEMEKIREQVQNIE